MKYKISASILNANFLRLGQEISEIKDYIDEIHLDIMDGHYVDNISFGPDIISLIRKEFSDITLDTHLMICNPDKYWHTFIEAGADILVFHKEATQKAYHILEKIKKSGKLAGISLNPATDINQIEPLVDVIDRVLIMTVEPGFGGQSFIKPMLKKIEKARKILGDNIDIEVDGGINNNTVKDAQKAGANTFVVGSHIFKSSDKIAEIEKLREILEH
ncbi:ribulose-phosphate 3-epimerase [Spirochaetia bacterium 38H-sp]|uniref:Ribulose-phosphate 3-epimerase n=1 Tax=Rarispira pelagica TaxID=3141764 RepID=A0ABU9UBW3_9SPIR